MLLGRAREGDPSGRSRFGPRRRRAQSFLPHGHLVNFGVENAASRKTCEGRGSMGVPWRFRKVAKISGINSSAYAKKNRPRCGPLAPAACAGRWRKGRAEHSLGKRFNWGGMSRRPNIAKTSIFIPGCPRRLPPRPLHYRAQGCRWRA